MRAFYNEFCRDLSSAIIVEVNFTKLTDSQLCVLEKISNGDTVTFCLLLHKLAKSIKDSVKPWYKISQ